MPYRWIAWIAYVEQLGSYLQRAPNNGEMNACQAAIGKMAIRRAQRHAAISSASAARNPSSPSRSPRARASGRATTT